MAPATSPPREARRLYDRSVDTLIASWSYFADGSPGARIVTTPSARIAVFTHEPDRLIFNNAVLDRELAIADLSGALETVAAAYRDAGVDRYAVWIHESQGAVAERLVAAGYAHDETTRTMAFPLDELAHVDTSSLVLLEPDYDEYLRINGLPTGLFPDLGDGGHVYLAAVDGEPAAALLAYDHDGDCGIYNVATREFARRRGVASALTAQALRDARSRGCTTASLQSTAMAERVYAGVGFRDLGCFHEYVPSR